MIHLFRAIVREIAQTAVLGAVLLMGGVICFGEAPSSGQKDTLPANNIMDVEYKKGEGTVQVRIIGDGSIERYKSFELLDPSRLVVDLIGVGSRYSGEKISVGHALLQGIRIGVSEEGVRLVLDIPGKEMPPHKISKEGEALLIVLGEPPKEEAREAVVPAPAAVSKPMKREGEEALPEVHPPAKATKEQIETKPEVVTPPAPPEERKTQPRAEKGEPPAEVTSIKQVAPPAQEEKLTGSQIAQRVYDRDDGKDSNAVITMVLIDSGGNKRERVMVVQAKDYGKLTKTLIRFTEPADIAGTGLLNWENEKGDDDQFLYLPELGRVRRIASSGKNRSFVNTDFTYEDLQRRKVEKDQHQLLREENMSGKPCFVLESIPKEGTGSQYTKLISWVLKESYLPVKVEYYGKGVKLEKLSVAKRFEKVDGIWTVMEGEMTDLKSNHRTLTKVKETRYNRGIPDDVFTQKNLEKY